MKIFDDLIRTSPVAGQIRGRNQIKHIKHFDLNRHGLAPLEMVLVLPILMIVMSVIIVFGYAAMWKLRSEVVSRDMVFRERQSHNFPYRDWHAPEWPESEDAWVSNSGNLTYLDDPVLSDPIIAGPIPNVTVNHDRLDLSKDVAAGVADLHRTTPIMSELGQLDYRVVNPLVDSRFQSFRSNRVRRFPQIYEIDLDFVRSSTDYQAALQAIANSPFLNMLLALDADTEYLRPYWWRDIASDLTNWRWRWSRAPDFYPRFNVPSYNRVTFDWLDRDWVETEKVDPYIESRIRRLPRRIVQSTISLYRYMSEHPDCPPGIKSQLEQKISELENYLNKLG